MEVLFLSHEAYITLGRELHARIKVLPLKKCVELSKRIVLLGHLMPFISFLYSLLIGVKEDFLLVEEGTIETVIDGKTGMLIDDIDVQKLSEAIKTVGSLPERYSKASIERAKMFSTEYFIKSIKKEIGYD